MQQDEGVIEAEEQLMYITKFYKKLVGQTDSCNITSRIRIFVKFWYFCYETRRALFVEELHHVGFFMEKNKSPILDGLPTDMYLEFWDVVKWDHKGLLDDF